MFTLQLLLQSISPPPLVVHIDTGLLEVVCRAKMLFIAHGYIKLQSKTDIQNTYDR